MTMQPRFLQSQISKMKATPDLYKNVIGFLKRKG